MLGNYSEGTLLTEKGGFLNFVQSFQTNTKITLG